MAIRKATTEDIPALVEMGAKFHAMSPHSFMGEYDATGAANVLRFMIESPQSLVLTNGKGMIGGTFAPVFFAPGKWMLEENYWSALPCWMLTLNRPRPGAPASTFSRPSKTNAQQRSVGS